MGFTLYMVEVRGVGVRTALQYCNDVRSMYRKRTGHPLGDAMNDLRDLGRRLTHLYPTSTRRRLPLLQQDYVRLWHYTHRLSIAHARLKAMLLVCFQSVSRFSDIIRCDMNDLTYHTNHMELRIRVHKTSTYTGDRFTSKLLAYPSHPDSQSALDLSASMALRRYLLLHPPQHTRTAPIFRSDAGLRWTYDESLTALRALLRVAGMSPSSYGLHSPRIGGATCALLDTNGNELLVKAMGFWVGDSVQRYCRPSTIRILDIQHRLISTLHTHIDDA